VTAPSTLAEALEARAERPEAVPVAGGTDLMVAVNAGTARPAALLDLSHVDELHAWGRDDGRIAVGAGVTFTRIAHEAQAFGALAAAALTVGSLQIRNRATLGGNVATASPAGDGLSVLAAFDADVVLAAAGRERRLRWDEFVLGPKRTALAADELVTRVEWRVADAPGVFLKVGVRSAMVIAIASVCVQLDPAARAVRIALGSVAPTVIRAVDAEALAAQLVPWEHPGRRLPALAPVGQLAAAAASPIDDVRAAAAYRRHAVEVLAQRGLVQAVEAWRAEAC
jgi:CO/xanthine dehydrogenase FAD-binding subunit